MSLKALIFDVDGTIAKTESSGHLRAFNEAFRRLNLNWSWDNDIYADLLQITGGKERIAYYINKYNPPVKYSIEQADIAKIHQLKTDIFVGYVAQGVISIRTGVERLVDEAFDCGLRLGIATTTSLQNVKAILSSSLGSDMLHKFEVIGAGDVVSNKKPAGDIYQYVLDELSLSASECIAFEDSAIGFSATSCVGIKTVVTLSEYTKADLFDGALVVVDNLGDERKPFEIISGMPSSHSYVSVDYLKELYE